MTWSADLPTTPGTWWCRIPGYAFPGRAGEPFPVWVELTAAGLRGWMPKDKEGALLTWEPVWRGALWLKIEAPA